ncbi:MAG: hypothetical protein K2H90_04915 [Oscillospiraceae bacterium]|nr:hypothetical protein [Oscillospiraceae bacterium]
MALSPTQLDRLPDNMIQLMSELQDEIISDICRRITKADMLTPTAEWQLYKANQLTISSREVKRRIAAKLKVQEKVLKDLYTDAVKTAIAEDAKVYKIAIAEGILSDDYRDKLTNYTRSAAFSNALKRGLKNTNGLLRNLTNSAAAAANWQLSDALDLAYLEVANGAFTPQEACFKAVQKLGADGIKCVSYASGRTDQIDVAVRRAVVTSIGKTCGDMQLDLAHEMDCQLVEVSSHLGARPSHAEWQGRIYSLVKGHPKYPYFYDATGYGRGDGLCGWNCRHSFFPYFEGLSKPANAPNFSLAENEKVYKDTQRQRSYECAIRKSKRELAALDGARSASDPALRAKLDNEFARKSATLKRREAALAEHLKATGLLPDNSRVRVDGFGRSVSQKAVWANKKYLLDKSEKRSILENKIASGEITLKINPEKQAPHMKGKEYTEGRSYLTISLQEIQEIVNELHGTGDIMIKKNGQIKEVIVCKTNIGFCVDKDTLEATETNSFTIHYSESRTHIVPAKRR